MTSALEFFLRSSQNLQRIRPSSFMICLAGLDFIFALPENSSFGDTMLHGMPAYCPFEQIAVNNHSGGCFKHVIMHMTTGSRLLRERMVDDYLRDGRLSFWTGKCVIVDLITVCEDDSQ